MSTTQNSKSNPESPLGANAELERSLGVGKIVCMVVAGAAPLATAAGVLPVVFALSGNPAAPLYYIVAAVVLAVFSVGFTLMSRYVENAGAFYSYVQAGMGKVWGGGAATLALSSYLVLVVGVTALFSTFAVAAADEFFGITLQWWVAALSGVVIVGLLGYRRVELNAKILGILLVVETVIVLLIDLAIVLRGGESGLSAAPLNPSGMLDGAPGLGLTFAFLGFIGFEATAVFRKEARDPDKTIPRATFWAIALIGLMYCFTAWCIAIGFGPADVVAVTGADPGNAVQNLAVTYIGEAMNDVVLVLLTTSFLASLLTFQNVIARYQYSLANGRILPAFLGQVHPVHRAPSRSSLVASVIIFVVLAGLAIGGVDPGLEIYPWFTGVATLGIIALMVLTSAAVISFHRKHSQSEPMWNSVIAPILSLIGLGYVLFMIIKNFDLLVGGARAANIIFVLAALTFAAGAGIVAWVKVRRPDRYAEILENN